MPQGPDFGDELLRLQIEAFRRHIPLMYLVVSINTIALGITHLGVASPWLTVAIPVVLVLASAIRIAQWWRVRNIPLSIEDARGYLRSTHVFAMLLGAGFVGWALRLAGAGNAFQQMHVAVFMGITSFACALCLMHVRTAALLMLGISLLPFSLYYIGTGNPVLIAIAGNIAIVASLVIIVQSRYFEDFRALASSRAEAQRLHGDVVTLAESDSLTKLSNRRRFFHDLGETVARAKVEGGRVSLILIDLDGFKQVNDVHGHSAGDQLLAEVAQRLRGAVDAGARIARLGGDEFGVMLDSNASDADLRRLGLAICMALRGPTRIGRIEVQTGASAGIASFPDGARTTEELYECADYALYRAKRQAKGTAELFTVAHRGKFRRGSRIEQCLRAPEIADQLSLAFQPIVRLPDCRIIGFEALARWHHPELGAIPPAVFIPAAERSGAVCDLTRVLFGQALSAMAQWDPALNLSFNLSAHDLIKPTSVSRLIEMTRRSRIDPTRIQFEITETAVLGDFAKASRSLARLKKAGFHVALDDFGVGYSSLSYLHGLVFDRIKVDKAFTAQADTDATGRSIVRTIIDLAGSLRMESVIEGVETVRQLEHAASLGCHYAQGYLFGQPVRADQIAAVLAEQAQPLPNRIAMRASRR